MAGLSFFIILIAHAAFPNEVRCDSFGTAIKASFVFFGILAVTVMVVIALACFLMSRGKGFESGGLPMLLLWFTMFAAPFCVSFCALLATERIVSGFSIASTKTRLCMALLSALLFVRTSIKIQKSR